MIQVIPFTAQGPAGSAQAVAERAAKQATAWMLRYAKVVNVCQPTSNVVITIGGEILLIYTLTVVAEIEGNTPTLWGDPAEPPEWKALTDEAPVSLISPTAPG